MLLEKEKEVQTLQNELRLAKEAEQKRNEVLLRHIMCIVYVKRGLIMQKNFE